MGNLLLTPRAFLRRRLAAVPGLPTTPSPLRDRVVVVTGASSGIGAATALAVARRGGIVVAVARREDLLAQVVDQIVSSGGRAQAYPCDLTDADAVDALVKQVLADHDTVHYLVNNAGRSIRRPLAESYDRVHDFERTMAINYIAPVRLTLGFLPGMRQQRFGHVVNVVTWGVQVKAPKFAAYIASKSALDVFARIAGREAYADNVTFTNVRLDLVRTEMSSATDAYDSMPAKSPEQAAQIVVRALEDRPITVNTLVGQVGEIFNVLAPRLSDATMAMVDRLGRPGRMKG